MSALHNLPSTDFKQVPQEKSVRKRIRRLADELAGTLDTKQLPSRDTLETTARTLLSVISTPEMFLGYAMVMINNAFWRKKFETILFNRRLLLLPHCLSNDADCTAEMDSSNLICNRCGSCDIGALQDEAEALGYEVITSEGTGSVVMKVLEGGTDAIVGVACLDSLEKSYARISEIGIPHMAVPLLRDGCVNTTTELDELRAILRSSSSELVDGPRSYVHLLRETRSIFYRQSLKQTLPREITQRLPDESSSDLDETESIALDWYARGGKRLRPFLTTASYAVARMGASALVPDTDPQSLIPVHIRRLALAIEAMHKASLIHDDIEDDDEYRYGQLTIHRRYGIGPAINVGDYLVGMGYNLVAGESESLGAECVADILRSLSSAHLDLCRGQGAELAWKTRNDAVLRPIDVLSVYALKTAPGLEVAIYAGLRAAGIAIDKAKLKLFCTYLGEGYQALNDLDNWEPERTNRVSVGSDVLADRPTILHAFALEACADEDRHLLSIAGNTSADPANEVNRLRNIYNELGAFQKTHRMVHKLRMRAEMLADEFQTQPMQDLMRFIVSLVLPATVTQ